MPDALVAIAGVALLTVVGVVPTADVLAARSVCVADTTDVVCTPGAPGLESCAGTAIADSVRSMEHDDPLPRRTTFPPRGRTFAVPTPALETSKTVPGQPMPLPVASGARVKTPVSRNPVMQPEPKRSPQLGTRVIPGSPAHRPPSPALHTVFAELSSGLVFTLMSVSVAWTPVSPAVTGDGMAIVAPLLTPANAAAGGSAPMPSTATTTPPTRAPHTMCRVTLNLAHPVVTPVTRKPSARSAGQTTPWAKRRP